MIQYLLDTDHFTLIEYRQENLARRIANSPGTFGFGIVTVEEALKGRLASLSRARDGRGRIGGYARLMATLNIISEIAILPYDDASEETFQSLLALRLRVGAQDLRIAAIALSRSLTVVTRNRRDFARIPGLITEDWSIS